MRIANEKIPINIKNVILQKTTVVYVKYRYSNYVLKCPNIHGLVCSKNTAKQLAPHQFTNLLCILIFENVSNRYIAPTIAVGAIYCHHGCIFLPNNRGGVMQATVTKELTTI